MMNNSISNVINKVTSKMVNQVNKKIAAIINSSDEQDEVISCNYPDNYYGDQYCQTK